jgi:hypothetical protein
LTKFHLTHRNAERTIRAVTEWGRDAELFAYEDKVRMFSAGVHEAALGPRGNRIAGINIAAD